MIATRCLPMTRHSLAEAKADSAMRLLVADDNMINQKITARMLGKLGYRVDVVANGQEALDALVQIPYATVFMDCRMPEMDGFSATANVRRREASDSGTNDEAPHRVAIIAMTANAMDEDRKRCLAAGMDQGRRGSG